MQLSTNKTVIFLNTVSRSLYRKFETIKMFFVRATRAFYYFLSFLRYFDIVFI